MIPMHSALLESAKADFGPLLPRFQSPFPLEAA